MSEASELLSRRALLGGAIVSGAGMLIRPPSALAIAQDRKHVLRFAHLTDTHIKPEERSQEGFAKALDSLKQLDPPPAFIFTGGDHIMDSLQTSDTRALDQWKVYRKTLESGTKLPVHPVLGNHDVYAWSLKEPIPEASPGYGKAIAMDQLQLKSTFYSFDQGGWHFIALDNISKRGGGYFGSLGDEQTEWLQADLSRAGKTTPICIVSHIPLISVCALFFDEKFKDKSYKTSDALMHSDVIPLLKLLNPYNVRLCISGHIHLLDQVKFKGINFICDGAVSGSWWKGPFHDVPEGYGVFDLFADGTFEHTYIAYGWDAKR